jgi:hypothetical protein
VTICPVIQPSGQRCNVQGHESTPTTLAKVPKRTRRDVPLDLPTTLRRPAVTNPVFLSPTPDTFGM